MVLAIPRSGVRTATGACERVHFWLKLEHDHTSSAFVLCVTSARGERHRPRAGLPQSLDAR